MVIPAAPRGLQPTPWLEYDTLWQPLTLGQMGSPTGPGNPTWLITGQRRAKAGERYLGLETGRVSKLQPPNTPTPSRGDASGLGWDTALAPSQVLLPALSNTHTL